MEITDVRLALVPKDGPHSPRSAPLLAYLDLVLDDELVVHNLKLIQGNKGVFLCMPGKEKRDACPQCGNKNGYQNLYCGRCGCKLPEGRQAALLPGRDGRVHLFQDVVHPITADLREYLLQECLAAYEEEKKSPGSVKPLVLETDDSRDGNRDNNARLAG